MYVELFATSSDHASFSCAQPSSSALPRLLRRRDVGEARVLVRDARERLARQPRDERLRRRAARRRRCRREIGFTRPEHLRVGVDLDDLRVLRPVLDPVLRQRAERPEARAERQHDVGLGDQLHRRLAALVAERPDPQRVLRRERIVVQIAVGNRRLQQLGERDRFGLPVGHHDAAAAEDHRELRAREQLGRRRRGSSRRPRRARSTIGRGISHSMSP